MNHEEKARMIAGPCDTVHYGHTPKAECCCGPCHMTRSIAAALQEAAENAAKSAFRTAAQEYADDIQRQRLMPVPPDHILTDDGAVRKVLEWSVNPLTGRIHAEIEAAEAARKEKA